MHPEHILSVRQSLPEHAYVPSTQTKRQNPRIWPIWSCYSCPSRITLSWLALVLPVFKLHLNEIILDIILCLFFSFSVMLPRFIHIAPYKQILSIAVLYCVIWIHHNLLILFILLMDIWVVPSLGFMKNAATNLRTHVFREQTPVFLSGAHLGVNNRVIDYAHVQL